MLQIKRSYEPPHAKDGHRVLIDRLWPRGIKKEDLELSEWAKALAPSTELRHWFGHDPDKWQEFQHRYREELRSDEAKSKIKEIAQLAAKKPVTLIYSAKDEEHNDAVVLMKLLETEMKKAR